MPGAQNGDRIPCPNDGCTETFANRMAKKRHLEKGKCVGTPKDQQLIIKCTDGTFQCTVCQKIIKQQNNVSRHRKRCKGAEPAPKPVWSCNLCDSVFDFESKLKQHMVVHSKSLHTCPKCDKTY